jgi:hypothetical protein
VGSPGLERQTCRPSRRTQRSSSVRHLALIVPASQDALGDAAGNAAAQDKPGRRVDTESGTHAQRFGNGCGGCAVPAALWPGFVPRETGAKAECAALDRLELVLQLLDVAHYLPQQIQISFHCIDSL